MTLGDRPADSDFRPTPPPGPRPAGADPSPGKPIRSFATWMGAAYVGQSRWPSIIGGGLVVLAAIATALWLVN